MGYSSASAMISYESAILLSMLNTALSYSITRRQQHLKTIHHIRNHTIIDSILQELCTVVSLSSLRLLLLLLGFWRHSYLLFWTICPFWIYLGVLYRDGWCCSDASIWVLGYNEKVPSETSAMIFHIVFSGILFFFSRAWSMSTDRSPDSAYSIKIYIISSVLSKIHELTLTTFLCSKELKILA